MILKVVPAARVPFAELDYLAPENGPGCVPGSLVRITVRGRSLDGVVAAVAETSEIGAARLRPVGAVHLGGEPVFLPETLTLLRRLAIHWNVPLPLLLLQVMPGVPRRAEPITHALTLGLGRAGACSVTELMSCYDPSLVRDVLPEDGPLLVLAPSRGAASWLAETLDRRDTLTYDPGDRIGTAFDAWTSLARGTVRTLIATRSGVFAPLPAGARIALFLDAEPGFLQFDALPHWDARIAARARARAERREMHVLGEAPTLASITAAGTTSFLAPGTRKTVIADMNDERRAGRRGPFSDTAIDAISQAIQEGKKAVVCVNRAGAALFLFCKDCREAVRCERCTIPVRVFADTIRCLRCGTAGPIPDRCGACGSSRIAHAGLTIGTASAELAKRFPGTPVTPAIDIATGPGILVGTEAMLHAGRPSIEREAIGAVVVALAEQLMGQGSYADAEEGYALLSSLAALAARQQASCVVQTYDPDHPAVRALVTGTASFTKDLLEERETFRYPPSYALLLVTVPDQVTEEAFSAEIRRTLGSEASMTKLGPGRFLARVRTTDGLLAETVATLPADWRFDTDPLTVS